MKLKELITKRGRDLSAAIAERQAKQEALVELRSDAAEGKDVTSEVVTTAIAARDQADAAVREVEADLAQLRADQAEDERIAELQKQLHPTGVRAPAYDEVVRVGGEKRMYSPDNDPKGIKFLRDVLMRDLRQDNQAAQRLNRHMDEERAERGDGMAALEERAAGTAAFSGLVVPQYLVDLVAPYAKAGRPFADACRPHDLPPEGMTVNLSKITTQTTTALQTENNTVSETDIDDTLLSLPVQTNAGSATLSYQAVMRGIGVDDTTMEDLAGSYGTTLDSTLVNQATNGLTNVATSVAYTDASPTAAELYPKLLAAISGVESALLNADPNSTALVMHSRRWHWLNSQLSSTFPLISQPNVGPLNVAGTNYGEGYAGGRVRGILPNGTPVYVDNNIATNLGAGTNEDEIYAVSLQECHLWEDPKAPMFVRTETGPNMKKLGVDIVLFGFFAYTLARYAHVQKIAGTGLVTPAFA